MTDTSTLIQTAYTADVARVAASLDYAHASDRAGALGTAASFRKEDAACTKARAAADTAAAAKAAALAAMQAEGITEVRFATPEGVNMIAFTTTEYIGIGYNRALE